MYSKHFVTGKGNIKVFTLRLPKVLKTLPVAQTHEEMQMKMLNLSCKVDNLGFSMDEITECALEDKGSIPASGSDFNLLPQ